MASFIEDLWMSVFTPGPTPTLLVATNVTFAALQTLLMALLWFTYSIHFFALSLLSAALWFSINWFAKELSQVQAEQEAAAKDGQDGKTGEEKGSSDGKRRLPGGLDTPGSDTETESLTERKGPAASGSDLRPTEAAPTSLELPGKHNEVRKRPSMGGESSGYVSTDSEWEKVEDSNGN
ncbi:putative ER membrane protein [Aspergillus campestris IBT 28561]|uniref:ER membrane protein n=1 Tax=Aspergillus campestris (strain IBT 28561) TaxID=1392248 RepID=A0A2I1D055_ASPC2|nr:putative ER membrane protein [Aspergillus campestris IBT 28561]PKY03246.1 putative ER membrane protein [Aspergillus campestris IBT 28561]